MSEVHRPSENRLSMRQELAGATRNVERGAEEIIGAASKIIQMIAQRREQGGVLVVQPQIMFLTGAMMRMMKDIGVLEHLQKHGVAAQRRGLLKKE